MNIKITLLLTLLCNISFVSSITAVENINPTTITTLTDAPEIIIPIAIPAIALPAIAAPTTSSQLLAHMVATIFTMGLFTTIIGKEETNILIKLFVESVKIAYNRYPQQQKINITNNLRTQNTNGDTILNVAIRHHRMLLQK